MALAHLARHPEATLIDEAELETLLRATAARDRRAFKTLYERSSPRHFAAALKILGRRDLAEEALQDAYLSIWDSAARFDPGRGKASAWMLSIVRRRAIDRLRASPWLQRETLTTEQLEHTFDDRPEQIALYQCLRRLDPPVRQAIYLAYLHGFSHRELAKLTGQPLGTLKSRIRRGLVALWHCLSDCQDP